MLDDRRGRETGNTNADSPDVVRAHRRYRLENIDRCGCVRAPDDGPTRTIPMLNQRPGSGEAVVRVNSANGPRIVVRGGGDAAQFIGLVVGVRTGDERPRCA